jgi:hypothetical protein
MKTSGGKVISYAVHNESGLYVGNQSHAAYTPNCLDCHGGNGIYYNDTWTAKQAPVAIAFNEDNYGSDYSAHKPLVEYAFNSSLSVGENEACISCHTNYSMKFEFKRPEWFRFDTSRSMSGIYVSSITYGTTNNTIIIKSASGAKHNFLRISDIECETCHSDVWQAANHTESRYPTNTYFSTKASHVCWQWYGGGSNYGDNPMHNITCVYSEYGINYYSDVYDNITEYCLLSCHEPLIGGSTNWNYVADTFKATVHAAHRISCYDCHDEYRDSYVYYFNKPANSYTQSETKHNPDDITVEPLFLHAETCIACKRDGADGGTYKTWTEPNNTMYDEGGGYYI